MSAQRSSGRIRYVIVLAFILTGMNACKKEDGSGPKTEYIAPDPAQVETINDITYYKSIVLGAQENSDTGGCLNLRNGYVYDLLKADNNQTDIDLALLNGSSTYMNLMTPASSRFSAWGSDKTSHIYDTWWKRNSGMLVRLPDPTPAEEALFEHIASVADVIAAYHGMTDTLGSRPGYNAATDGPANSIHKVDAGNIILFYSEERHIAAIMKVGKVIPGNAGALQLLIKTGTY